MCTCMCGWRARCVHGNRHARLRGRMCVWNGERMCVCVWVGRGWRLKAVAGAAVKSGARSHTSAEEGLLSVRCGAGVLAPSGMWDVDSGRACCAHLPEHTGHVVCADGNCLRRLFVRESGGNHQVPAVAALQDHCGKGGRSLRNTHQIGCWPGGERAVR